MTSSSLVPGTTQAAELVQSLDLPAVTLPYGALSIEVEAEKAIVYALRNVGLNLVALPSEFLHTLQPSVVENLKA